MSMPKNAENVYLSSQPSEKKGDARPCPALFAFISHGSEDSCRYSYLKYFHRQKKVLPQILSMIADEINDS